MKYISGLRLLVLIPAALLCLPSMVHAATLGMLQVVPAVAGSQPGGVWTATQAEHIYGLQEIKPHKKGTLTLSADALTFTGKSSSASIPRNSMIAVSVGNQRVEMGGVGGRIMRMAIPDGGGLAVAAIAHHQIDMLTVEFSDGRGGAHSAVFFLAANQAEEAIRRFALQPREAKVAAAPDCQAAAIAPRTLLVAMPDWHGAQVPAVYQGLLYEHMVERFRTAKGVARVYREGESIPGGLCPQYTVHLTVTSFKEGSSVKRAMLGPAGMFVGTTQLVFDAQLNDRAGNVTIDEEIKATVRGEAESTNVADKVAKSLEKKYEKAVKTSEKKAHAPADATKV